MRRASVMDPRKKDASSPHTPRRLPNPSSPLRESRPRRDINTLNSSTTNVSKPNISPPPDLSLTHLSTQFATLTLHQRQSFLLSILKQCDPQDMLYLNAVLPRLHRDFIRLLPTEPVHRILSYVHPRDFCTATQISRPWQHALRDVRLWHRLYARIGLQALADANYVPEASMKVNARKIYCLENWAHGVLRYRSFRAHGLGILSLAFDGRRVVTGSADGECKVFEARSGEIVANLVGHEEGVFSVCLDDDKAITGSADSSVRVWNLPSGTLSANLKGHNGTVTCLRYKAPLLVSGSSDKSCRIWQFTQPAAPSPKPKQRSGRPRSAEPKAAKGPVKIVPLRTLHGHNASIKCLDFTPHVLISGDIHGVVRLWHLHSGNCLRTLEPGTANPTTQRTHDPVSCLQFTGARLTFGTFSGRIYMYTVKPTSHLTGQSSTDYETLQKWASHTDTFQKQQVFMLGDKWTSQADSSSSRNSVNQQDSRLPKKSVPEENSPALPKTTPQPWSLCLQTDSWRLISGCGDGRCVVWNYLTGRKIYELHKNTINTGSGPVVVRDEGKGSSVEREEEEEEGHGKLGVTHGMTGVAFDDRIIVVGGMDGVVRMFVPQGLL
ncbi:hypothetical protein HK097_007581 [Rhizophlyctis rosea]|uniref:F-box domain-containing protein n=1 Tax=Rhizophlyctis rosea TaxID=64517 RepID=A0AAD5SLV0_9FUNG|nr:hypothetical protein HK097_007581 [Rhizophlyctis rosea]